MSTSPIINARVRVPGLLPIPPSFVVRPRKQGMAQVVESLSLTWEAQTEFLAAGFSLVQSQLWWVFAEWGISVSLTFKG